MLNSLVNLLAWIFVIAIATGSGLLIWRWLRLSGVWAGEILVVSAGFGFMAIIYGTAALGGSSLLQPAPIYVLSGLLTVVAALGFREWKSQMAGSTLVDHGVQQADGHGWARWLWLPFGIMGMAFLLSAMTPPLEGDTLHSYLEVPRRYLDAGAIIDLPYEFFASLPLNMQMLSAFALLFRGDELAQMLTSFTMAAGGAAVLFVIGRRYFNATAGALAGLFFLSTFVVEFLVPSTKVNLGWVFFDLLAVYALCRWAFDDERKDRWLLAAGLFSGAALGSAYMAALTAAILGAFIVARTGAEHGIGRRLLFLSARRLGLYGVPVVLLASPWLIKSFIETGNPVHPALSSFFVGHDFENASAAGGAFGIVTLVWKMSTQFAPYPYGKPIGPVFLALLPVVFLVRREKREAWLALAFVAAFYVLWYLFAAQRPRNLLTPVAIWGLVAGYSLVLLGQRSRLMASVFVALFAAYFIFELGIYTRLHFANYRKLDYVLGRESRTAFLERNLALAEALPTFPMVSYMNEELPSDARVAAMYTGNGYYVNPLFIDSRMLGEYFNSPPPGNADALIRIWHENDITHVFANDRYPRWDAAGGPPDARLLRSEEFRQRYLQEVFEDMGQHLYRVSYPQD